MRVQRGNNSHWEMLECGIDAHVPLDELTLEEAGNYGVVNEWKAIHMPPEPKKEPVKKKKVVKKNPLFSKKKETKKEE